MLSVHKLTIAAAAATMVAGASIAQIIATTVVFPRGGTATTIAGTIRGDQTRDYLVRASAGQVLRVRLNGAAIVYFNVLAPGSNDAALFVGSSAGNSFSGTLRVSGPYKIRVYQMRASARRGEVGAYRLSIAVEGRGPGAGNGTARPALVNRAPAATRALVEKCRARVAQITKAQVTGVHHIDETRDPMDIFVTVKGAQAPWRCEGRRDGTLGAVEFSQSEGAL